MSVKVAINGLRKIEVKIGVEYNTGRNDTGYRREENEKKSNHCYAAWYGTACMRMSADTESNG